MSALAPMLRVLMYGMPKGKGSARKRNALFGSGTLSAWSRRIEEAATTRNRYYPGEKTSFRVESPPTFLKEHIEPHHVTGLPS